MIKNELLCLLLTDIIFFLVFLGEHLLYSESLYSCDGNFHKGYQLIPLYLAAIATSHNSNLAMQCKLFFSIENCRRNKKVDYSGLFVV